jgi:hypothetical protein
MQENRFFKFQLCETARDLETAQQEHQAENQGIFSLF